jgi:hypothetical protein
MLICKEHFYKRVKGKNLSIGMKEQNFSHIAFIKQNTIKNLSSMIFAQLIIIQISFSKTRPPNTCFLTLGGILLMKTSSCRK